ncbi:fam-a protein [Plasmodium vinckei brucechwatti]|uniref:Fam-a protein n=1 Tax=Plasmodium vinckei brucechwatti TaxID=119398 RepID=A0A6V7SFI3_PLAVN|nr:fam-a protein [Plasmodium vinckei brucechwatti]
MNNFYIHVALFLLSIFVYVNNIILVAEYAPIKDTTPKATRPYLTTEEIYEKNKHLLCTDPEETKEAEELMNEAINHLKYHAIHTHDYDMCVALTNHDLALLRKKLEDNNYIENINIIIYDTDQYDEIINEIWDPNHVNPFNNGDVKIARVYNPNLVMIQQRYKKGFMARQKYFYALAKKAEISENTTVIVMTSANINDHYPSNKEYKNTLIEKANLFTTDIDSEEDIRKGKLKKVFVSISGYIIEKFRKCVEVTYIEAIDGHENIKSIWIIGECLGCYSVNL